VLLVVMAASSSTQGIKVGDNRHNKIEHHKVFKPGKAGQKHSPVSHQAMCFLMLEWSVQDALMNFSGACLCRTQNNCILQEPSGRSHLLNHERAVLQMVSCQRKKADRQTHF